MAAIPVMEVARSAVAFWRAYTARVAGPLALVVLGGGVNALGRYAGSGGMAGLGFLVEWAAWVMGSGALLRLAFAAEHEGDGDFEPGRLGLQWTRVEWRLLGAYLLTWLARLLPLTVGSMTVVMASAASVAHNTPMVVITGAASLISFGAAIFVWVCLLTAGPATVAEGKITLPFSQSKGERWRMLGVYALVLGPVLIVLVAVAAAITAAVFGAMGRNPDTQRLSELLAGVPAIAILAFGYLPLSLGVVSELYRRLRTAD